MLPHVHRLRRRACRARELRGRRSANFPNNFQQQRARSRRRRHRGARERKHEIAFKTLPLGRGGEPRHASCSIPLTPPSSDTDARRCTPHVWPQWRVSLELKAPERKKITPDTCSARHPPPPSSAPSKPPFSPYTARAPYPTSVRIPDARGHVRLHYSLVINVNPTVLQRVSLHHAALETPAAAWQRSQTQTTRMFAILDGFNCEFPAR